jgi:alkaline phosphatase D
MFLDCIPRPLERSEAPDGGPLRSRVTHRVAMWRNGERPRIERRAHEGDLELSG